MYKIKCKIKQSLKKDKKLPDTLKKWYRYGRMLGKGAYGKINLCVQTLSMKLCAVKSINIGIVNQK